MAPRIEAGLGIRESIPTSYGVSYDHERTGDAGSRIPVNAAAREEVKKQVPIDCPPCDLLTIQQLEKMPPSPQGQVQLTAKPTEQKPCVSLFVGTDPQSQQLLHHWNTDRRLQELRQAVNFQPYAKDNTLYRERYSQVVPTDQFPAIIVTDFRGGHIYAAGRHALPGTADSLHAAIVAGFKAYAKAKEPTPINATGSSSQDCPDGNCPPQSPQARQPFLNPNRQPVLPLFRDREEPIENLFYWLWRPGTAVLAFLCAVAFVVLMAVIFVKAVKR